MIWMLLLLLLPLALLMVRPYWFSGAGKQQSEENLELYRERCKELESSDLDEQTRAELQLELDREFLAQSDSEAGGGRGTAVKRRSNPILLLIVLLLSAMATTLLYQEWGAGDQLMAAALLKKAGQVELTSLERQKLARSLTSATEKDPDNLEWAYLNARLLSSEGQFEQAVAAFERILEQLPEESKEDRAATLTLMAEARFYAGDQQPDAEIYRLLTESLSLSPGNRQTLGMAGIMAFELNQPAEAIGHWRTLWEGLPKGPETMMLEKGIRRAAEIAAETGTHVDITWLDAEAGTAGVSGSATVAAGEDAVALQVRVSLSEEARASVKPGDVVFVLARAASGPPMPLAVQRMKVSDLPRQIVLSDAQAMAPGMNISSFESLTLVARVSKSGQPAASPGDWQVVLSPVNNRESSTLDLVISELIN